ETNGNTGENFILLEKRTEIPAKIPFYWRNERKYRRKSLFRQQNAIYQILQRTKMTQNRISTVGNPVLFVEESIHDD
ncbi:MAG TPA: hypothetical protein VJ558_01085, partial [Bacillales bacterium]|nr:hypothetical protein [Bacillales bacterium]